MRKYNSTILTAILLIFLASCDPSTGEVFYVKNNTNFTIKVLYNDFVNDNIKEVMPNETALILEYYDTGATTDLGDDFLTQFFDTIYVSINDSVILEKDIQKRANWDFKITDSEGIGNAGIGNYTFIIHDEDLIIE